MSGMYADYQANAELDALSGVAAYPVPTQLNLALFTARGTIAQTCAGTNLTEVTGGGYARVNVGVGSVNWNAAAARAMTNKLAVAMGTPSGDWGTVVAVALYDQSGNMRWWDDLPAGKPCPAGVPVSFAAGAISMGLPQGA
jgi:hypothetical protein